MNPYSVEFSEIYPNPVSTDITVRLKSEDKEISYELYDVHGKSLIQGHKNNSNGLISIDVNFLENGIYLLKIADEPIKKIIKVE